MLSLISFILVCIGCINWFCIGILQFDFVAGIFGSQSNIFSRLIYTLVGVAAVVMIVNFITNRGKFVVSFKKADEDTDTIKAERTRERRTAMATEASDEFSLSKALTKENEKKYNAESSKDNYIDHNKKSSSNKNNDDKQV